LSWGEVAACEEIGGGFLEKSHFLLYFRGKGEIRDVVGVKKKQGKQKRAEREKSRQNCRERVGGGRRGGYGENVKLLENPKKRSRMR